MKRQSQKRAMRVRLMVWIEGKLEDDGMEVLAVIALGGVGSEGDEEKEEKNWDTRSRVWGRMKKG
jgi:hypothetical protein